MANCILCETSEAVIGDRDGFNVVNCPRCGQYVLAKELPSDPEWSAIAAKLSGAVQWKTHSGQGAASVGSISEAKDLVLCFEMDQENWEDRAVQALIQAGDVPDLWGEPIRAVAKSLGMLLEDAKKYVEDLDSQHKVCFDSTEGKVERVPGMEPFPIVYWWEKCTPDPASKPGY
jgi:DNA-directed RNA polymerase subunit RPC12/RpoP